MGDNALAHFDRDVIAPTARLDTVVLMMGINDIGWPGTPAGADARPRRRADDIIGGYKQLIDRAHMAGLRIIAATLTPFEDTFKGMPFEGYYNEDKEKKREAVNDFIRSRRLRRRHRLRRRDARSRAIPSTSRRNSTPAITCIPRRRLQGDGGGGRPQASNRQLNAA